MSGIINWLRGDDKIAIMTLLQVEMQERLPEAFAKRPKMAQWVLSNNSEAILSAVQQLVGSIVGEFPRRGSDFDITVNQNDKLRDKTPDCSLVVDISDADYGVLFRVYLTGFIKSGSGGWK